MKAKEYTDNINDQVMFVSLIETQEAVDNIDSILAVDGMDALLIGAVDLAISLGVPFDFQTDSDFNLYQRLKLHQTVGRDGCLPARLPALPSALRRGPPNTVAAVAG